MILIEKAQHEIRVKDQMWRGRVPISTCCKPMLLQHMVYNRAFVLCSHCSPRHIQHVWVFPQHIGLRFCSFFAPKQCACKCVYTCLDLTILSAVSFTELNEISTNKLYMLFFTCFDIQTYPLCFLTCSLNNVWSFLYSSLLYMCIKWI